MINLLSAYSPRFPRTVVYMLQSSEYKIGDYLHWLHRTVDFSSVAKRRQLDMTSKAKGLLLLTWGMFALFLVGGFILGVYGLMRQHFFVAVLGLVILLSAPIVSSYGIILPLVAGHWLIQKPKQKKIVANAKAALARHPATKIAIAGSYGKTTFREQLYSVLAAGKKVAAAPGNLNTPLGISTFVSGLKGDEEILIFEFGEHYPGDVMELCKLVEPELGVVTGINESHLEKFKTIDRTVATIFELRDYLGDKPLYKNQENVLVAENVETNDPLMFSHKGCNGWSTKNVSVTLEGTTFVATKGERSVKAESQLLGEHIVGVLVACIAIAEELGLSDQQIEKGISETQPFEHRMQPRHINGAIVIDDTYNGNIDGVKAGLHLLKSATAVRRIYVTPGLVEQGSETARVHELIGALIAESADVVYLMNNSTTSYIKKGLEDADFAGSLTVIDDPLEFYMHIDHYIAKGDVVLMQNDWTDNYQ